MCLGEKRLVTVPPRMGWSKNNAHHDTIRSFAVFRLEMQAEMQTLLKIRTQKNKLTKLGRCDRKQLNCKQLNC